MKTLTTAADLSRDDLDRIIGRALEYTEMLERGERPGRILQDRVVANIFFEPSTRSRLSFELAATRLGAHVLTHHPEASSSVKGESDKDTVMAIVSIGAELLVVRHRDEGFPQAVHEWSGVPVLNAGDGAGEHPTQAILDAATLVTRFGGLAGIKIGVVGDIRHSRVVGSLMRVMPTLGARMMFIGPDTLLPESTPEGIVTSDDLDAALASLDVVYVLRVQNERGALVGPSYEERFRLDQRRSSLMKSEAVILHPGPMNRGVEMMGPGR